MKQNTIITPALFKSPQKNLLRSVDVVLSHIPHKDLSNIHNKKEIHIYDLGFCKKNKIIPINNHINKTGINPLREKNTKNINFYDITNIYEQHQKGKTAECFGSKQPTTPKSKQYIQTRFLCNYVIIAHQLGFKKIFAYVVN